MSSNCLTIALCIIAAIVIILWFLYRHQFLKLKLDNLVLVDGGVGAGKTSLTATLAIKKHKSNLFKFNLTKNVLRFIPPFCWLKKIKNMDFNNPP